MVAPAHRPVAHESPLVQASPSLHSPVYGVAVQPDTASHRSTVHGLPSLQMLAAPPMQALSLHTSLSVQASPSLQVTALARCTQPVASEQVSSVQALVSVQPSAKPMQLPCKHASLVLQTWPSSQVLPSRSSLKQPVVGSQPEAVQGFVSLQSVGVSAEQRPATQMSPVVQAFASLHAPS